jgi:hypothetical protein
VLSVVGPVVPRPGALLSGGRRGAERDFCCWRSCWCFWESSSCGGTSSPSKPPPSGADPDPGPPALRSCWDRSTSSGSTGSNLPPSRETTGPATPGPRSASGIASSTRIDGVVVVDGGGGGCRNVAAERQHLQRRRAGSDGKGAAPSGRWPDKSVRHDPRWSINRIRLGRDWAPSGPSEVFADPVEREVLGRSLSRRFELPRSTTPR